MGSLKWIGATVVGALAVGFVNASAAEVKEINFVEAVHNLGYINLYEEQRATIFEKNGLKLNVSAASSDTQAFTAVSATKHTLRHRRRDHGADVARGRRTGHCRRAGRTARALFRRFEEPSRPDRSQAVQGPHNRDLARAQHQFQCDQKAIARQRNEPAGRRPDSTRSTPAPRNIAAMLAGQADIAE